MHVLLLFSALVHDFYIYNMNNHDDSRPVPQTTVLPPVMLAFPNEVPCWKDVCLAGISWTQDVPKVSQSYRSGDITQIAGWTDWGIFSSEISFTAMSTFPSLFHRCHGSSWHQNGFQTVSGFLHFFCGKKSARGQFAIIQMFEEKQHTHTPQKRQVLEGALAAVREVQKSPAQLWRLMTSRVTWVCWTCSSPSSKRGFVYAYFGFQTSHLFDKIPIKLWHQWKSTLWWGNIREHYGNTKE